MIPLYKWTKRWYNGSYDLLIYLNLNAGSYNRNGWIYVNGSAEVIFYRIFYADAVLTKQKVLVFSELSSYFININRFSSLTTSGKLLPRIVPRPRVLHLLISFNTDVFVTNKDAKQREVCLYRETFFYWRKIEEILPTSRNFFLFVAGIFWHGGEDILKNFPLRMECRELLLWGLCCASSSFKCFCCYFVVSWIDAK